MRTRHARAGCALLEAEAESRRIGLPAAGPGDVLVEPVRVTVVGDEEIGPPVAVEIGEDCTEAVVEPRGLEACLDADLAKLRMALAVAPDVEVEEIADARDVVREARSGAGNRDVGVGVARDVQVGPAVAVHVCDRGSSMPPVAMDSRGAGPFTERAVAVVPQ